MLPLEDKSLWLHCIQYAEINTNETIKTNQKKINIYLFWSDLNHDLKQLFISHDLNQTTLNMY